jgi:tetratricopeptide (TPR) repeat protein
MSEAGTSFSTYTRLYKDRWRELMEPHDGRRMLLRSYTNGSVATTWTISYTAVRARNEAAANLLLLWAHLDNKDLWHGLLAAASRKSTVAAERTAAWLGEMAHDEVKFIEAIGTLRSYSLVEEAREQTGHGTHPVVHQWMLHMQDDGQRTALSWLAVVLIGLAVPMKEEKKYWEIQARLLPHAERCEKRVGGLAVDQGAVQGAGEWDGDKETYLWAANNLALLYSHQGKLDKAEAVFGHVLEGYKKGLRLKLSTVGNLGNLYRDQGKLDKAEELYKQVLEGYTKALGKDHTSTLVIINNLGLLYRDQGKLDKAEEMFEQALEGYTKALGKDHTSTLDTVHNFGLLYRDQGKLDKAEEMFKQALVGSTKALGKEHTSTIDSFHCLAILYSTQGKLGKAKAMFEQALEGYTKALGKDHTSTLNAVRNLGSLYMHQGELGKAEEMYTQALQGYKKTVGSKGISSHVPALDTILGLGLLSESQGRADEAKAWYSEGLSGYEKVFGKCHPKCQPLRDNLAAVGKAKESGNISREAAMQTQAHDQSDKVPDHLQFEADSRRQRVLKRLGLKRA